MMVRIQFNYIRRMDYEDWLILEKMFMYINQYSKLCLKIIGKHLNLLAWNCCYCLQFFTSIWVTRVPPSNIEQMGTLTITSSNLCSLSSLHEIISPWRNSYCYVFFTIFYFQVGSYLCIHIHTCKSILY